MSAVNDYLARVRWHQQHCEWHNAWKKDNEGHYCGMESAASLLRDGERICFRLENGYAFFGKVRRDNDCFIDWVDTWETAPGYFADCYAWESIAEWCKETENHPGIPVVRTY